MTLTARGTLAALALIIAGAFFLAHLTGGMEDPAAPRETAAALTGHR